MLKKELMQKLKALGDIDEEQRNSVVCSLIGHSDIVEYFFGYVSCSRCGEQLGDTLGSIYDLSEKVLVGHDCEKCRKLYAKMNWRDKLYAKDPGFSDEEPKS